MQRPSPSRVLSLIALSVGILPFLAIVPLHAQQTASALSASAPTNGLTFTLSTDHPASVTYKDGRLSVIADNTSLNQILNAISRVTGMKVTGTVAEEHVFGNYGPDTPTKVLTALLEGTSSNVLITQNPNHTPGVAPIELVLTPRGGPPSPPNPHPQSFDSGARSEPVNPYPIASPPPPPPPPTTTTAPAALPGVGAPGPATPGTDPNATGLPGGTGASSPGTTLQQSPNDIKTPQQIYEQLQQLRQQQQQQQQQGRP